ncbi:MAG TPA: SDR family NAD(P)-dependent oxidoreductase [Actinomycetota bacterium]|nr:SDR family NAD(P)-dependent oxidoreductase [Actinomycetota bacterium]
MRVPGRTAAVTGGASGLGRATACALHAAGASVALIDLPGAPGEEAAAALGDRAGFFPADVTSGDGLAAALAAAEEALGAIGIAVSCAGVATSGRVLNRENVALPLEAFESVVRINLVGTFNLLRLAAARMAGRPPEDGERGVIVLTASVAAFEGQIGQAAYSASKGGVVALTLTAARDLARAGIRVAAIAPGLFDTPMLGLLPEEARQLLAAGIPHPRRLGRPEEFAALVRHIVENPMINGEVIRLDGALRMPPK